MRRVVQVTAVLMLVSVAAPSAQQRGPSSPRSATGRAVFIPRSDAGGDRTTTRPAPTTIQPFARPRGDRSMRVATFPIFWGWALPVFYVGSPAPLVQLPDDGPTGGVQLDVTPWRSRVYVDGVLKGRVDDFRGYYRPLELVAGPHQITIVDENREPVILDVVVTPGNTTTYRATLSSR